jgi:hypothetical protein
MNKISTNLSPGLPNNRYAGNKEFTPIQKGRKDSNLTTEDENKILNSSPQSYYKYFKKHSGFQKLINLGNDSEEISFRNDKKAMKINLPLNDSHADRSN